MLTRVLAVLMVVLCAHGTSFATITVTMRKSGGDVQFTRTSGQAISITLDDTVTRIWITSDSPSTEDIGRITLSGARRRADWWHPD